MWNFQRYLIGIISFFILTSAVQAQQEKLLRGEINSKDYNFIYFVPLNEKGLLTIEHSVKFRASSDNWEINSYSKNLIHLKQKKFTTGPGHRLIEYYDDQDSLFYGFFAEDGGSRKYEVIKYNYLNGNTSKVVSYGDNRMNYNHFDMMGSTQFVAGIRNPNSGAYFGQALFTLTLVPLIWGTKIYKEPANIFYHNYQSGQKGKIQPLISGECIIFATKTNPKTGIYALIIKNIYRKKTSVHYFEYDKDGKEIKHTNLTTLNSKNLLSGSLIISNDSTFAFVGTYNEDKRRKMNTANSALGMFVSNIVHGQESMVKFHPFSEFNNAKKALDFRSLKRFEESKRKGENIDLGFKLLMHQDIIQMDSVYVLISESYYPEYHFETYNNFYGSMYSDQIFDGYRFSHAITAGFNKHGDLLWDNIFRISDIISYNLDENVVVYFDGKTQVMLYYVDSKIYSQVISGSKIIYKKDKTEVQTVGSNERVLYENYGKIYHWYGPYFLLTGFQQVVDDRGKRRKVYFFLKLKFD